MAFEGMDPVAVRDIAGKLDAQAKALGTIENILQQQVDRARSAWQGPAASHFEASWNSQYKQTLQGANDQLSTMSTLLKSEAAAQDKTSQDLDGPGGGSGALPGPGSGGGNPGSGSGGPGGGADGPGGDKKGDPEGFGPWDYAGWGITGVTLPALAAAGRDLGKILPGVSKLVFGKASNLVNEAKEAGKLDDLVKAGTITRAEADARLAKTVSQDADKLKPLAKLAQDSTELAKDGGFADISRLAKVAEPLSRGLDGLAGIGDVLSIIHPGAPGWLVRGPAIGNLVATAAPYAVDAAVDGGLLTANAALDWVPVAGQVLAVGTAAYLAYQQIPFIHDAVNNTVSAVGDFGATVGKDVGHFGATVGTDIGHAGATVGKDIGHAASSAWNNTFGKL